MTDTTFMRTWAEIDLDALDHNYKTLRGETEAGCRFLGLCKANAYGHGAGRSSSGWGRRCWRWPASTRRRSCAAPA